MLTLDDFYRRIIEPAAAKGDRAAIATLKARDEAKAGILTPQRCRELAMEAIP